MRKWSLYIGVLIPITTIGIYILLDLLGKFVAPPNYEVLFAENSDVNSDVNLVIEEGELNIFPNDKIKKHSNTTPSFPTIIRFNATTGEIKKYSIGVVTIGNRTNYFVAKLDNSIVLDTNIVAKDGYKFKCNDTISHPKAEKCLIKKSFRKIRIPDTSECYNIKFLGWITKK